MDQRERVLGSMESAAAGSEGLASGQWGEWLATSEELGDLEVWVDHLELLELHL